MLLLCAAAGAWWIWHKKTEPPRVPFAKAKREALVSTLPTNGKVEPIDWQTVRAESEGLVEKVPVQEGQVIAKGALVAQLSQAGLAAEPDGRGGARGPGAGRSGHARSGRQIGGAGRYREQPGESAAGSRSRLRDYNALRRLVEKQAATVIDVQAAQGRLREADLQIEGLQAPRARWSGKSDKSVALARLREAEAAVAR